MTPQPTGDTIQGEAPRSPFPVPVEACSAAPDRPGLSLPISDPKSAAP